MRALPGGSREDGLPDCGVANCWETGLGSRMAEVLGVEIEQVFG